ncbi:MAG: SigE family RNA polymerase sigma factor [Marmoricola sp.]
MQRRPPGTRDTDFAEWMAARQPALLRTAYLITGDAHAAEDLVQTALAKVYLAWDRIDDHGRIDGYVRKVMVNEHTSLWRRAWKRREVVSEQLPDPGHDDTRDDGTHDALWRYVATLPRKQRAVLVLRYYEQLTEAETAQALDISVGTVKSQCSRALARLRDHLDEHPELSLREEDR